MFMEAFLPPYEKICPFCEKSVAPFRGTFLLLKSLEVNMKHFVGPTMMNIISLKIQYMYYNVETSKFYDIL